MQKKPTLFKYGPRAPSPTRKYSNDQNIQQAIANTDLIVENQELKQQIEEQKHYINKLLTIINTQKQEIEDKRHDIKLLEIDLKNHKQFNEQLQETVTYLSERNLKIVSKSRSNYVQKLINQNSSSEQLIEQLFQLNKNSMPQIFEKFMILSVDKTTFFDQIKQNYEKKEFRMDPCIIYCYPSQDQHWEKAYKAILPQIVYPYGVESRICRKSDSQSELNGILYNGLSLDKFQNVSVITFKNDQDNNTQGDISNLQLITNPNNLLFCICLELKDFFDDNSNKKNFISVSKTYVFTTKLPFIQLFVDILHIIVSDLKIRKSQVHNAMMENQIDIDQFDLMFHLKYKTELEQVLGNLIQTQLENQIYINLFNQSIRFTISNYQELTYMDCDWGAYSILNELTVDQFLNILSALLCEQQVVIISQQKNILSSAMLLFHSLLKPFKWPHPFISSISQNMFQILDSPVPIFLGIFYDDKFLIKESLYEQYPNIFFIEFNGSFMDNQLEIIFNQQHNTSFISTSKSLTSLRKTLNPLFSTLKLKINLINQITQKNIIPIPDEHEITTYKEIFHQICEFYQDQIIKYLPTKEQQNGTDINYKVLLENIILVHPGDIFIQNFVQTQIFVYYLDEKFS